MVFRNIADIRHYMIHALIKSLALAPKSSTEADYLLSVITSGEVGDCENMDVTQPHSVE